jgi:DNA-binding MarR family transcriptional regulator
LPGTLSVVTGQPDDQGIETWATLLRAQTTVLRLLEAEMEAERGLPIVWYEVLLHLGAAPRNRLRLQELTERILLTQSGVSRLVERMVAAGLIDRSADDTDRRGRYAGLTTKGRRVLREAAQVHRRGIHEHFLQHLTHDEQRVVRRALAKVQAAADTTTTTQRTSP